MTESFTYAHAYGDFETFIIMHEVFLRYVGLHQTVKKSSCDEKVTEPLHFQLSLVEDFTKQALSRARCEVPIPTRAPDGITGPAKAWERCQQGAARPQDTTKRSEN